ncbi:PREDICTED: LRR receptor-like serine/threonine-protein kinase HSL2 [Nicotiana attenuata]|uniref:LRR receptor-like serine/threonine-protein kinase HSL2 n=1 Tax=Nicotiana attenuata TaxID=49451 RepID=UPI0009055A7D|nr:PREDICTED: LRR receptor-like serine/threonine-protein kinase HSL2 [Nicotiana attenuata]
MDHSHNQLTGSIPKGLGDLPGLDALDLSHNQLSVDISKSIEYLRPRISAEFLKLTFEENCFDESNLCSTSNNNLSIPGLPSCSSGDDEKALVEERVHIDAVNMDIFFDPKTLVENKEAKCQRWVEVHFISQVEGNGASGKVYRAVIEVRILGSIRHNNIVRLVHCISSVDRNLLVDEYFEKQSLDKWLHRKRRAASPGQSSTPPLDWEKRLKIAIGAAQGLCYMRHDCTRPIIHRDIKSSYILLDSEFNAKIAKMLAKRDNDPETASAIAGTFGYIAPEYASTFKVNVTADIYSFGVVLLELITGREPILRDEQMNLAQWSQHHFREGNSILKALDEEIMETSNLEQMIGVFKVGLMHHHLVGINEGGSSSQNVIPTNLPVNSPMTEGPSPAMGGAELVEIDEAPSIDEIISLPGAEKLLPTPLAGIREWIEAVLSHTGGHAAQGPSVGLSSAGCNRLTYCGAGVAPNTKGGIS